jgi:regulator of replication initiation timing
MSDTIKMLASILRRAQGTIDAETGKEIDVGYEVTHLKDEFMRLRAENEALVSQCENLADENKMLEADNAALRGLLAEARKDVVTELEQLEIYEPKSAEEKTQRDLLFRIDAAPGGKR